MQKCDLCGIWQDNPILNDVTEDLIQRNNTFTTNPSLFKCYEDTINGCKQQIKSLQRICLGINATDLSRTQVVSLKANLVGALKNYK